MLESRGAFERLDEIAAVPGIDALTIGPTDLAQDLGVLGTPAQRDVIREHRVRLGEAARKHGKTVAMAVDTLEAVREVIALGATIVNYSSDVAVLRSTFAAAVAEIRKIPKS
jgi:2-dehydro-3-deoxyglucarate aldolase/4-hydroxy-2-oxoheptanedioate aldolase